MRPICRTNMIKTFFIRHSKDSKKYENSEIIDAVNLSKSDRNSFWKLVGKARKGQIRGISAIRKPDKTVVHQLKDVLCVWRDHFTKLGTPKDDDKYDERHRDEVNGFVNNYNASNDTDEFLQNDLTVDETFKAISTIHLNKSPGYDGITTEHVKYAGPVLVDLLCTLFNAILSSEYIPQCFKRGVQVPLYKGKDTCTLDPNNYRGITLLPTFNKLLEILIWQRIKGWWYGERVISDLQGACREGYSCVHTAFNLRETVATSMESTNKCFVAFYDVAKAFDTVWIEGLFKQIYDLGITGKTWRLLYRGYLNFKCCVKLQGSFSDWYYLCC